MMWSGAHRFSGAMRCLALARLLLALMVSLRGTVLLYQGEELGLPEAEPRRDQLKDPVGYFLLSVQQGARWLPHADAVERFGARIGFTTGNPWLPLSPDHRASAVWFRKKNAQSTLAFARKLLALRRTSGALRLGDIEFVDRPFPLLAFVRSYQNDRVFCAFNMSAEQPRSGTNCSTARCRFSRHMILQR